MLKNLLQLLLETFIKSKYKAIAYQMGSKHSSSVYITTSRGEFRYTAPETGYFTLRVSATENSWFRIENESSGIGYVTNSTSTWKYCSIFAKKGDAMVFDISQSSDLTKCACYFIPCIASS